MRNILLIRTKPIVLERSKDNSFCLTFDKHSLVFITSRGTDHNNKILAPFTKVDDSLRIIGQEIRISFFCLENIC